MTTTVNSITVYETKVRGTATSFIRESVVNTQDVAIFDAAETAGASAAGIQTVNCDGNVVGGNATGLANDATAYTASINIDGTTSAVSVVGSAAQTYTTLITEINADLPATEASISGGNIVLTSTTTGKESYVVITDTDLFSSLTDFLVIDGAVDGGTGGDLVGTALTNGADAWTAYSTSVEVYDTAADKTVIASDFAGGDLNPVFSDTEVEAEVAALGVKVNALQNLVK